ncbi:hypothetical protein BGX27_000899 [Mortierella sp. AM989]|nr:hypothetical protein BGX27_000899 [Mortierella sp. AM989]
MFPVPRRGTGSKSRQTYGRQRSFLDQEEGISSHEGGLVSEEELQDSPPQLKRGNSDLSNQPPMKRSSSGNSSGSLLPLLVRSNPQLELKDSSESKEQKAALKASHELWEVGQNHKFKDEIEYILDGIRSAKRLKIRRTSCIELGRSMLKHEFTTQVKAHQYMPVIFEIICNDRDPSAADHSITILKI